VIAAFAVALGAFDAEHVELALDVAEDEIGAVSVIKVFETASSAN
jgi:hypothetical protein